MKRRIQFLIAFLICTLILLAPGNRAQAEEPVVHAVLFYSPTCGHCYQVISEDLPPLIEKYGDQLMILGVNTHTEGGNALYQAAIGHFQLPPERVGVPMLIVEGTVLVGSYEIPTQFPGIVENGLSRGGIDWPAIPGLLELIEQVKTSQTQQESTPEVTAEPTADDHPLLDQANEVIADQDNQDEESNPQMAQTDLEGSTGVSGDTNPDFASTFDDPDFAIEQMSMVDRFMLDKTGNTISVITLLGMVGSVLWIGIVVLKSNSGLIRWPEWAVPLLILIGLIVAAYMAYVEVSQVDAVCGPVGDCNAVQQSAYARLFGLLPVGVIGIFGYLAMLVAWLIQNFGPLTWRRPAGYAVWAMALLGTVFSIYLTFLEPFVIGATCAWCLTSAVVITLILWATSAPLVGYLRSLRITNM